MTPSDLLTQAPLLIEMAKKATAGEWIAKHSPGKIADCKYITDKIGCVCGGVRSDNAEAICALHNEAPALLEALMQVVERQGKALEQAVNVANLLSQHDDFRTVVDPSLMKTYRELDAFMDARSAPAQTGEVKG